MTGFKHHLPVFALALNMALAGATVSAAEIRGSVSVQQGGLFNERGEGRQDIPVSVALFPAEGQSLPRASVQQQEMTVSGSRIQPLYTALPRGSRLRFHSEDGVHHELFTHSHTQPLSVRLDRAGMGSESVVALDEAGDLHWFCRIHAKSYARVDVVDTPLVRMLHAGESFEFRDLQPGKWRLRVAAPGAETRIVEALALTAPPPLQIPLAVKGLAQDARAPAQPVAIEQLFPSQPGL
ncbi:MAG TPA: hypothetical protein VIR60_11215 [Gammaproteobacteria bacterium]